MKQDSIFRSFLGDSKLYIADVGATGGPENIWESLLPFCHFYTFDPDPRAQAWKGVDATHFPVGLWSESCQKTLYLTSFPQASSLFELDRQNLDVFRNASCHSLVGEEIVHVDTLDFLLAESPLDFLKIDAEGAELEILKGGKKKLVHCLGLQLETSFIPRHKGAPLFSEIELFLREYGFQVFQIQRERWLRKKGGVHFHSSHQLVWGNTLFLLSEEALKQKLKECAHPKMLLTKYFFILHAYRLHDYAYSLAAQFPEFQGMMEHETLSLFRYFSSLCFSLVMGSCKYFFAFSQKSKSRRKAYLMRKVRALGNGCLNFGKMEKATLYDD